jgi:triosephosphate isomerase
MRKKMVAGNWKMHGSRNSVMTLLDGIKQGAASFSSSVEMVVLPSFVFLQQTQEALKNTEIAWGAQNFYLGEQGAFTGEVSGPMLTDYGCQYVLVGHSERRMIFKEELDLIAAKFKAAQQVGLKPILCVGETLAQREQSKAEQVITEQLESVIEVVGIDAFLEAVVAYEPVWAIGTGLTATPDQAQEMHAFIRSLIRKHSNNVANTLQLLYGGSVKADNAAGLFSMPDIDGGLIGGASLDAKSFLAICEAGVSVCTS